jgi:hypothetical protein
MNISTKTRFVEYVARMRDIRNTRRSVFLVVMFEEKGFVGNMAVGEGIILT